jgi:chaperonin GroES
MNLVSSSGVPLASSPEAPAKPVFTFTPFHGNVHVEKVPLKDLKTKGGIVIPETVNEKAAVFRVLAVGPGYLDPTTGVKMPMTCRVGDLVLVDVGRVVNVAYGGQECLVCQDADVYGKVQFEVESAEPAAS